MCMAVEPDSGPPGPRAWGLARARLAAPCLQAGLRAGLWAGVGHLLWVVAAGQALMPGPSFSVLQVLGFEIDAVNSVQFSNHTGKVLVQLRVGMRRGPLERWGSRMGKGHQKCHPTHEGGGQGSAGLQVWTAASASLLSGFGPAPPGRWCSPSSLKSKATSRRSQHPPQGPSCPSPRLPLALALQVTLWPRGGPGAAGGRGCALLVSVRDQCLEEPVGVSVHRDSKAFWAQKP